MIILFFNPYFPYNHAYGETIVDECPKLTTIEHLDWFSNEAAQYIDKVDGIWKRGTSVIVVDVETGMFFKANRNGGTNHADAEPETKKDTAILKKIYNGTWSWDRRPALILIGEKTFAISINGMPHGGNRITENAFGGHSCYHFLNSRLHVNNKEDEKHQQAVQNAFNANIEDLQILIDEFYESENNELND